MSELDVAVIVGSASDLPVINETLKVLKNFGLSYSLNIASAHRTPNHLKNCIEISQKNGVKVFIAAAGMSAALAGIIASETLLPVIGVPIEGKNLASLDSLLSIVQMPRGVPVAAVALGKSGAVNAAILAVQIISISDEHLRKSLKNYRKKASQAVEHDDLMLQKDGIEKFLSPQTK
ncbi:MAG: 5-(carboxyamino)imidazole ribonucleotide mutase [Elusimicrobiota bacterium]|jgi:5-(carboxyamino)imidazole ribonucleotide mutase|nr:5-(carboxyamino)imidazole ribonucleotide mutase [Elusimicrobiota bacterium]